MKRIGFLVCIYLVLISLSIVSVAESGSFVWVQMSDPHAMPAGKNAARENVLKETISEINDLKPDFVVVTGDLVESPSEEAYQNYVAMMGELDCPFYNVIGNHDDNSKASPEDYVDLFRKYTGGPSFYSFDWKGYHFVVLDSVKPKAHSGSFHSPEDQLSWLEKDLSDADGKGVMLFSHHPPTGKRIDVDDYSDLQNIMKDHDVRTFYSGHRHGKPLEEFIDGICFVNTGALSFPLGGSKLGYRINTVNGDEMWTAWVRVEEQEAIINRSRFNETEDSYEDKSGQKASGKAVGKKDFQRKIYSLSDSPAAAVLEVRYAQERTKDQPCKENGAVYVVTPDGNVKVGEFQDYPEWTNALFPIPESLMAEALSDEMVTLVFSSPGADRRLWIDWVDLGESTVEWRRILPHESQ